MTGVLTFSKFTAIIRKLASTHQQTAELPVFYVIFIYYFSKKVTIAAYHLKNINHSKKSTIYSHFFILCTNFVGNTGKTSFG